MRFSKAPLLAFTLVIGIGATGCGGGGSTTNPNVPLSCGPSYLTPNYVQATDPGDNEPNKILTWPGFPLNVYFASEQNRTFGGNTYNTSDLFYEAFQRWVTASSGSMQITEVASSTNADITVNVNQLSAAPGGGGTLGFTSVTYYPSSGQIVSATITMNVWPGMTVAQFRDGLKSTAGHEFGHALFLQGHSDQSTDLMYFQGSSSLDKAITQRDQNSFLTAYCGTFASRSRTREAVGKPGEEPVTITFHCRD